MTQARFGQVSRIDFRLLGGALFFIALAIVFTTQPYAFTVDETLYIEMARAMAERGSFNLSPVDALADGPTILRRFTHDVASEAMPQYPSGYAVIAAPFYALFGLKGLVLLNLISAFVAVFLTWRIGRSLFAEKDVALHGAVLFGAASFISCYAFGIWPHMLSLAILLAGAERLAAAPELDGRSRLSAFAMAGLWLGIGLTIRVDMILAIFAALIWIRLFAAPSHRLSGVIFLLGLLPGLALATGLNLHKFEALSPIAYGPSAEDKLLARYQLQIIAAGLAFLPLLLIDFGKPWVHRGLGLLKQKFVLPALLILGAGAILAVSPLRSLAWNIYVLLVDLQQIEEARFYGGMVRDTSGYISFLGIQKTALLQSLPFLCLAGLAIPAFFKGEHTRAHAVCLAMISGPILFYALTQWHGGYSINMRYFIPILPFACLLSGWALHRLIATDRVDPGLMLKASIIAGAVFLIGGTITARYGLLANNLFDYYVPLAIVAILVAGLLMPPSSKTRTKTALSVAISAAIAFGAIASIDDYLESRGRIAEQGPVTIGFARILPPGSVVFASVEEWMVGASLNGVHIAKFDQPDVWVAASEAYSENGRCVYFQASANDLVPVTDAGLTMAGPVESDLAIFPVDLYYLQSQAETCRPDYSALLTL